MGAACAGDGRGRARMTPGCGCWLRSVTGAACAGDGRG
ncbi:hypothetical protein CRG98_048960, partial [Punica granatum]